MTKQLLALLTKISNTVSYILEGRKEGMCEMETKKLRKKKKKRRRRRGRRRTAESRFRPSEAYLGEMGACCDELAQRGAREIPGKQCE